MAHRRTSDGSTVNTDCPSSVSGNFGLSAIREALQTNEQQSNVLPLVVEDEDKARTEPQTQCADFCVDPNKSQLRYNISVQPSVTPEMARTFKLFQHCLELRDKYTAKSLQRLGDNPRDHDGHFNGIAEGFAGVSGVQPHVDFGKARVAESPYKAWKIYPKPLPPHWHFTAKHDPPAADGHVTTENEQFDFPTCQIPKSQPWEFRIDDKGVYQVYSTAAGMHVDSCILMPIDNASQTADEKPMFDIPSIREYFIDLDHVLGVISDGPAKSIAYRRLKYLASKFEMYRLLNESQELAAMKVGKCYLQVIPYSSPVFRASLTGQNKL